MILIPRPNSYRFYSLKMNTAKSGQTITSLKRMWSRLFPAGSISIIFSWMNLSGSNIRRICLFGTVFGIFAFVAILIACFGLLGLSAYNVLQRTKEIGIRKVMGATVNSILILLSRDFLKLILVALILAIPLGWFIMSKWLDDYAFRINIGWWVFAIAGFSALVIAVITICIQTMKAATTNPVTSLRSE